MELCKYNFQPFVGKFISSLGRVSERDGSEKAFPKLRSVTLKRKSNLQKSHDSTLLLLVSHAKFLLAKPKSLSREMANRVLVLASNDAEQLLLPADSNTEQRPSPPTRKPVEIYLRFIDVAL